MVAMYNSMKVLNTAEQHSKVLLKLLVTELSRYIPVYCVCDTTSTVSIST